MKIKKSLLVFTGISFLFIFLISGCKKTEPVILDKGISDKLAKLRDKQLNNLKYYISFQIPDSVDSKITGHEIIKFDFIKDLKEPLILDFRNPESFIRSVKIDKKA